MPPGTEVLPFRHVMSGARTGRFGHAAGAAAGAAYGQAHRVLNKMQASSLKADEA